MQFRKLYNNTSYIERVSRDFIHHFFKRGYNNIIYGT